MSERLPDISFRALPGSSVILPGLYQGDQSSGIAAAQRGFDMVLNLTPDSQGTQPAMKPGSVYRAFAISDGPEPVQSVEQLRRLDLLALEAAAVVRGGGNVLIHCAAGLNRSGLVCAMVVRALTGCTGAEACARVQTARPGALFNPHFLGYLQGLA